MCTNIQLLEFGGGLFIIAKYLSQFRCSTSGSNELEFMDRMASYAAIKTNALEEYLMTWKDTSGIYSLVLKRYKIINVSDSVLFFVAQSEVISDSP